MTLQERAWLRSYPPGIEPEINLNEFSSILDIFEKSIPKYRGLAAYKSMGTTMSYNDLDKQSRNFAAYLQNVLKLQPGDRIAIMMPNCLQYPVALFGAIRAGLVVVNTNPLYTPRELEHQLNDSGAKAILVLANMATTLQQVIAHTKVEHVIVTELGDLLKFPKNHLVNVVVKHVKKMVPAFNIVGALKFNSCLSMGSAHELKHVSVTGDDIAFLQYTGGTTGVAKGAMLTHMNMVANMQQISEWMKPTLKERVEIAVAPLPMYHIFSMTVNCLTFMKIGGCNLLITNPRDIPAFVKELSKLEFTTFIGLNTLFNALCNNAEFRKLEFSKLKATVGGGMAVQGAVNDKWKSVTGQNILEGFGLTESSPVLCCNPLGEGRNKNGTIGIPVPSTLIKIVDDDGKEVKDGEPGEIWGKGPQIMKGYWQRPEETAKTVTPDGWLKTGDIAIALEGGFFKIVDRKKDMILVSGFNVYPNEIEEVAALHPGILESAAIGIPNEHSGEVVKLFVVKKDPALTEKDVIEFCKKSLTGYKVPKSVEFRSDLPKSPVGKILRKDLRSK